MVRAVGDAFGIVVQAWPSTLRWSSYDATPEPSSVAASQATVTGTPPVPIPRPTGSVISGAFATGALVSARTVSGAVPVTAPLTVATTCAVPGLVATKWPFGIDRPDRRAQRPGDLPGADRHRVVAGVHPGRAEVDGHVPVDAARGRLDVQDRERAGRRRADDLDAVGDRALDPVGRLVDDHRRLGAGPSNDEGRRTAAVEVDRLDRPTLQHQLGQLGQAHALAHARLAAVDGRQDQPAVGGQADRTARMDLVGAGRVWRDVDGAVADDPFATTDRLLDRLPAGRHRRGQGDLLARLQVDERRGRRDREDDRAGIDRPAAVGDPRLLDRARSRCRRSGSAGPRR